MIRVVLPYPLRLLARAGEEVTLEVPPPVTLSAVLDALESAHPALRGAIRIPHAGVRRPMLRFYACRRDFSNDPLDTPLPAPVAGGAEPLLIVGAISGG